MPSGGTGLSACVSQDDHGREERSGEPSLSLLSDKHHFYSGPGAATNHMRHSAARGWRKKVQEPQEGSRMGQHVDVLHFMRPAAKVQERQLAKDL